LRYFLMGKLVHIKQLAAAPVVFIFFNNLLEQSP